ncbi:MAG: isoamylase [Treponema sp.]|nr:isoamylase [Treponema sp.]MDE6246125.1 glycogen-binding domain-containing protein [Treponemataceae bacterium]MBD5406851.1 isoamylase [Treponema sp.]MBD5409130.1 isoamylase [Treponema sp.]MBD5412617.1 isoamylase [Treponema sp.]
MKNCFYFITTLFIFFIVNPKAFSQEQDLYEYNNIIHRLEKVQSPIVTNDYIIFTQEIGHRFAGIAFDFENYSIVHKYMKQINRDIDGNITSTLMFFLLKRPADVSEITYRVIIDGIWTEDPMNPVKKYDPKSGLTLSYIDLGGTLPKITGEEKKSTVKFIYNGKSGQTVRLGGSFTNWDSRIYKLTETKKGFYELDLPLPQGKHYYNYYIGMQAIPDKTNPNKAYTSDGRIASVIVVE